MGRYKEAQDVSNDLLRNDSTNVEAIYIRGLCLYYEDNLEKALSHFQQVLKLAPDFAKAKETFKVCGYFLLLNAVNEILRYQNLFIQSYKFKLQIIYLEYRMNKNLD